MLMRTSILASLQSYHIHEAFLTLFRQMHVDLQLCEQESAESPSLIRSCVVFMAGLDPERHLGKSLAEMEAYLHEVRDTQTLLSENKPPSAAPAFSSSVSSRQAVLTFLMNHHYDVLLDLVHY